jgi:hypothetical protein
MNKKSNGGLFIRVGFIIVSCASYLCASDSARIKSAQPVGQQVKDATQAFVLNDSVKENKKYSKNELKENIGHITRDVFHITTHLERVLGAIQVSLAEQQSDVTPISTRKNMGLFYQQLSVLQDVCSDVIEKLVDNQRPFKKAGRQELQEAYSVLKFTLGQLSVHDVSLRAVLSSLKNNNAKNFDVLCNTGVTLLSSLEARIQNTKCLKRA